MKKDPVVEEVHRIRERMWDECGGDLDRLIDSFRASETEHQDRVIGPEKVKQMRQEFRPPVTTKRDR